MKHVLRISKCFIIFKKIVRGLKIVVRLAIELETVSRYYDKLFGSIFETRELEMVRV